MSLLSIIPIVFLSTLISIFIYIKTIYPLNSIDVTKKILEIPFVVVTVVAGISLTLVLSYLGISSEFSDISLKEITWDQHTLNRVLDSLKPAALSLTFLITILGIVAIQHRSNQTASQLELISEQNKVQNYFLLLDEFQKYLEGAEQTKLFQFNSRAVGQKFLPHNKLDVKLNSNSLFTDKENSKQLLSDFYQECTNSIDYYLNRYIPTAEDEVRKEDIEVMSLHLIQELLLSINFVAKETLGVEFRSQKLETNIMQLVSDIMADARTAVETFHSFNPHDNLDVSIELSNLYRGASDLAVYKVMKLGKYCEIHQKNTKNLSIDMEPKKNKYVVRFSKFQ